MGQIAPRENLRANFSFVTDRSMDPGQYTFKIRCGGREVLKKSFTLTANSKLPTAAKDALDQDLPSSTAQCPVPMVEQSEPDQKETAQPESAQSEPDQSEPALVEPEQPRTTKSAPE